MQQRQRVSAQRNRRLLGIDHAHQSSQQSDQRKGHYHVMPNAKVHPA